MKAALFMALLAWGFTGHVNAATLETKALKARAYELACADTQYGVTALGADLAKDTRRAMTFLLLQEKPLFELVSAGDGKALLTTIRGREYAYELEEVLPQNDARGIVTLRPARLVDGDERGRLQLTFPGGAGSIDVMADLVQIEQSRSTMDLYGGKALQKSVYLCATRKQLQDYRPEDDRVRCALRTDGTRNLDCRFVGGAR